MNISDIRLMSSDQLEDNLLKLRKELLELMFFKFKKQPSDSKNFSKIKKDIARVLTVLCERKEEKNNA